MVKVKDIDYFINKVLFSFSNELKHYEPDVDLPYSVFGCFALYVNDLIKNSNHHSNAQLTEAKSIIEEMALVHTPDVKNLFIVGFLEVFGDENTSVEYANHNLSIEVNQALRSLRGA